MTRARFGAVLTALACHAILQVTLTFGQDTSSHEGITEPVADAILSIPVSGIITHQHFHEGDTVSKDAVILELDRQREEMEVLRQTTLLNSLKKDLERTRTLFESTQAVSQEELDQKADAVSIAEVDLAIAEVNLNRRRLIAPFTGIIADLFGHEVGEGVEIQAPLARLVDTSRCLFVCNLSEPFVKDLKTHDPVSIAIGTTGPLKGTITFISPLVDPSSGFIKVKALFENSEDQVRPGASGTIRFSH